MKNYPLRRRNVSVRKVSIENRHASLLTRLVSALIVISLLTISAPAAPQTLMGMASNTARELRFSFLAMSTSVDFGQSQEKYRLTGVKAIPRFIAELNEHGKQGFRLIKVAKNPIRSDSQEFERIQLFGLLERADDENYEYDWFEVFSAAELEIRISERARKGYYFKESFPFTASLCGGWPSTEGRTDTEVMIDRVIATLEWSIGNIIIVEKRIGNNKENQYMVAAGTWGTKRKPEEMLRFEMKGKSVNGFRPITAMPFKVLNRHSVSVLLENDADGKAKDGEYEIVISEFGFEKKVNRLAKNGYRLLLPGEIGAKRFALMERSNGEPVKFSWVNANSEKEFTSRPQAIFNEAAFQSSIYELRGCDYVKSRLVFYGSTDSIHRRIEVRLIKFTNRPAQNPYRVPTFMEISDDARAEFNELVNNGFIVRDLIYSDGIQVIMEKDYQ